MKSHSKINGHYLRPLFIFLSTLIITLLLLNETKTHCFSQLLSNYGGFFVIGIIAAIFANTTGAGGGIVFLPAFIALGLTPLEALATSFAIQCFGMTAGSISWLNFINSNPESQGFSQLTAQISISSILGLLLVQWLPASPPLEIQKLFGVFSILVATSIFLKLYLIKQPTTQHIAQIAKPQRLMVLSLAFLGGMITGWLSIGVGEIIAVLLIILGVRVYIAISLAVLVSAITVIIGVMFHIFETQSISIPVLIFAAPGAIIGGSISKYLATLIDTKLLKVLMACWILITAIIYLLK